jgi:inosine-uridine nucleoside N-ribohydrolase
MGGAAFVGGNASPAGEANILNDPEAADIVFGAECPDGGWRHDATVFRSVRDLVGCVS